MRYSVITTLLAVAVMQIVPLSKHLFAEEPPNAGEEGRAVNEDEKQAGETTSSRFNIAAKTAGGTQMWTDHRFRDGYHIQQNSLTGHWRLLDPSDVRKTWGTRAQCESVLDELKPKPSATDSPGHVVVLLHGLMRTRHSMKPLEAKLRQQGHDDVIRFGYASSRRSISDHANALRSVLEDLPENTQLSFVGHSMGNIVVRHLIGDLQRDGDPQNILPRCRSLVMLGPPNQGAAIARRLAPSGLYGLVTGKGGLELGPQWDDFVQNLATPPFPFAIIAGDVSDNRIKNPLVDNAGDLIVGVEEAKLDGSESFETLPVLHSFLMSDQTAMAKTIEFIDSYAPAKTEEAEQPHSVRDEE